MGVNAPGRPTMIMFLPLAYFATSMVSGSGKSLKSVAEGSLSPALAAKAKGVPKGPAMAMVAEVAAIATDRSFMVDVTSIFGCRSGNFTQNVAMVLAPCDGRWQGLSALAE